MSGVPPIHQLRWLMILRVVTVTTLLISVFSIELLLSPVDTVRPLFLLAAVAYGMVLVYAALDRWLGGRPSFLYVQLIGDALVVTGFVGITGGLASPMSFLYLIPICVASMMLYRRGGLVLAGVCWLLYSILVSAAAAWAPLTPVYQVGGSAQLPGMLVYSLVVHLVGMAAVALLSSYLSERLRAQGHELAERRGAVVRLQALNENIIESINSGLITTDLAGKINFINRGGRDITRYAQPEVKGRSIESLFGLEQTHLDRIRKQLQVKRRLRFERDFRTADGRAIHLGFAASNLKDRSGRPLGYIFIFQDLTEIRALEQEVRLKERMAALGEMAAGMAHELRNPLAAISGAVQYLRGALRPSGETFELMDIILRESQRLDQTIRDFLTFARPGRFNPERANLVKLLEDSVKLLKKSAEFRPDHRIRTRYAGAEVWCDLDTNRMKQVFWNLATNALKAMSGGGELCIEVGFRDDEKRVEICFADQGRGMSREQQERYFQPFGSSFDEGTGLGAAIVYRLVGEHGGRIKVESTPGRGTEVRIIIPRRSPKLAAEAQPPAALHAVGG